MSRCAHILTIYFGQHFIFIHHVDNSPDWNFVGAPRNLSKQVINISFMNYMLVWNMMCRFWEHWSLYDRACLVPRPQYYASVIRFGSRGPGRKVWPRQKSEKWDNLSHFSPCRFRLTGGNSLSISGRGTAREKHFKLHAFGLMFIGQVKRPIWI